MMRHYILQRVALAHDEVNQLADDFLLIAIIQVYHAFCIIFVILQIEIVSTLRGNSFLRDCLILSNLRLILLSHLEILLLSRSWLLLRSRSNRPFWLRLSIFIFLRSFHLIWSDNLTNLSQISHSLHTDTGLILDLPDHVHLTLVIESDTSATSTCSCCAS